MSKGFVRVLFRKGTIHNNMFGEPASELHVDISLICRLQVFYNENETLRNLQRVIHESGSFCDGEDPCGCTLKPDQFPIILVTLKKGLDYIVYPTEEERNKLLRQTSVLDEILLELRYNPDAGSRVAEARNRFESVLK